MWQERKRAKMPVCENSFFTLKKDQEVVLRPKIHNSIYKEEIFSRFNPENLSLNSKRKERFYVIY